jgi:hypothetical protein
MITVNLLKKEFLPSDYRANRYKDYIVFDLEIDPSGIEKDVRAVKGVVLFKDLFGEEKLSVQYNK